MDPNASTSVPYRLPPGFTQEKFIDFISRATKLCGEENVQIVSKAHELKDGDYMNPCKAHDMHALYDRDFFVASAVVAPRDVPGVQDVVRLCNEFSMPVWPYSAGRNTGYGGTAPRVPGSLAMDLGKNLNRVLEVNKDDAFALVEPGVTYFDLHEYLEKHNLREHVWLDVS
jgi:FAD/FMN-containing dehydrogenase